MAEKDVFAFFTAKEMQPMIEGLGREILTSQTELRHTKAKLEQARAEIELLRMNAGPHAPEGE